MPEVAKPKSPRRVVVVENATDLIRIGAALGARRVALCGSVARCEDIDDSDIDFYVFDFRLTESLDNLDRANQLVSKYRRLLKPYAVDVRGIPGWCLDPAFEASMRRDSIDLATLLLEDG